MHERDIYIEKFLSNADAAQRLLDVAADSQAGGHHGSVTDPRAACHRREARVDSFGA